MVNLKKLIAQRVLDIELLAKALFPKNRYPAKALKRTLEEKKDLTVTQLKTLSEFTRVPIVELLETSWEPISDKELCTFTRNGYIASLNTTSLITTVWDMSGKLLPDMVLSPGPILMSEYFNYLDNLIKKYEDEISNRN